MDKRLLKRLSAPLLAAALWTIPLHSHADTQPLTSQDTKLLTSQIVDQYAEHIFYNSGAVGMALVVSITIRSSTVALVKRNPATIFAHGQTH